MREALTSVSRMASAALGASTAYALSAPNMLSRASSSEREVVRFTFALITHEALPPRDSRLIAATARSSRLCRIRRWPRVEPRPQRQQLTRVRALARKGVQL